MFLGLTKQQWKKRLNKAKEELSSLSGCHTEDCEGKSGFACSCGLEFAQGEVALCERALDNFDQSIGFDHHDERNMNKE